MGGILKGATGAGAPVLAVPALAMVFDVQFAVVVMLMPNLLSNLMQGWRFRQHLPQGNLVWRFAFGGAVGVVAGTVVLASFSQESLSLVVAFAVFGYVALRLARPDWRIGFNTATRMSLPAGLAAGMLQGASGVSAPVSISFLNAIGLERPVFIATISIFFAAMTVLQIPALGYLGILSTQGLAISLAALLPILVFMPVGAALARQFSRETFDRAILILLSAMSARLVYNALA